MENDSGRGSCPSSYPSGNQVDGLPLVAIIAKQRGGCTTVLLTMKKWFLKMSAAIKMLGDDIIVVEHILKFIEMVLKFENDFEISEFHKPRTFVKVEK